MIISISFLFSFCKKKAPDIDGQMVVIKGCEGTYLRSNDLDHTICNEDMLDKYANGSIVKAAIVNSKDCVSDRAHCYRMHGHATADGQYLIKEVN